jgi:hypothetical protein
MPTAIAKFSALDVEGQLKFLAKFGHNLTVAARDTFIPQSDGVRAPERLRRLSETQHRVFGHMYALMTTSEWRYPDDAIVSIMLEHDDHHLRAQAAWAFQEALGHVSAA